MIKERREKRVAISLTQDLHTRLVSLAKITGKPPAVVVREILTDYLDTRAEEITEAQKAAEAYHTSLKNLRYRQPSLFSEEAV